MGEGCFRSIQLINNFVSVHTPLWGKFDLYSYPNQSPSQGDFEAFGHKEIALHKKIAVAPLIKYLLECQKRRQMSSDIDGISTPTIPMTSLKVAATNVNK
jgi:hypothetical protein